MPGIRHIFNDDPGGAYLGSGNLWTKGSFYGISPSGDTTGITDYTNLVAALTFETNLLYGPRVISLAPGDWYINILSGVTFTVPSNVILMGQGANIYPTGGSGSLNTLFLVDTKTAKHVAFQYLNINYKYATTTNINTFNISPGGLSNNTFADRSVDSVSDWVVRMYNVTVNCANAASTTVASGVFINTFSTFILDNVCVENTINIGISAACLSLETSYLLECSTYSAPVFTSGNVVCESCYFSLWTRPGIDALPTISSITTPQTLNFSAPHNLILGQRITLSGCDLGRFNGTFTVTALTSTTAVINCNASTFNSPAIMPTALSSRALSTTNSISVAIIRNSTVIGFKLAVVNVLDNVQCSYIYATNGGYAVGPATTAVFTEIFRLKINSVNISGGTTAAILGTASPISAVYDDIDISGTFSLTASGSVQPISHAAGNTPLVKWRNVRVNIDNIAADYIWGCYGANDFVVDDCSLIVGAGVSAVEYFVSGYGTTSNIKINKFKIDGTATTSVGAGMYFGSSATYLEIEDCVLINAGPLSLDTGTNSINTIARNKFITTRTAAPPINIQSTVTQTRLYDNAASAPVVGVAITSAVRTGGAAMSLITATVPATGLITLTSPHGILNGTIFYIIISGATPSGWNGSWQCKYDSTVNATNQFTILTGTSSLGAMTIFATPNTSVVTPWTVTYLVASTAGLTSPLFINGFTDLTFHSAGDVGTSKGTGLASIAIVDGTHFSILQTGIANYPTPALGTTVSAGSPKYYQGGFAQGSNVASGALATMLNDATVVAGVSHFEDGINGSTSR